MEAANESCESLMAFGSSKMTFHVQFESKSFLFGMRCLKAEMFSKKNSKESTNGFCNRFEMMRIVRE